ncbi:hypothetical protein JCGZ_01962 [Jatropha curcas]|uniref:Uncharacterized protein n=1 Tax=Jatropha curcas TaxID=180498 RepID=A0A067JJ96_JATCU|nr:hypothetical protein JCGZ_01962 [Jatropha curcas]
MSAGTFGDNSGEGSQMEDPQLKLVMESILGQFRTFNNSIQDMRKELQEFKAAQRSNTIRVRPSTTPNRFKTHEEKKVDNPNHYFRDLNNKLGRVQERKNVDYLNRYSFTKDGWMTIPRSFSSKEVDEDQYGKQKMSFEAVNNEKECKNKTSENILSVNKKKEGEEKEKQIQPIFVPLCKEDYFTTNDLNPSLPSVFVDLLHDYKHVVPEESAQSSYESEKVVLAPLTPQEVNIDQKKLLESEKEEFTDVFTLIIN